MNGLRSRVRIEADSKLMSGRDVAIAALLGAEEFGFGTGPLVAMGCVMMRVCNLDTCPMGICTQNPELRKRFKGKPEYIMNFMRFMAEDLREYMAKLGVRTVDELVGRTCLLYTSRPSRYYITKDGRLILSSEVGVLDIPAEDVVRKDRLRPGKMLLVDTVKGELVDDDKLKADYASRQPYGEWLDRNLVNLRDLKVPNKKVPDHTKEELVQLQKAFGYRYEDVSSIILPMAKNGGEPAGAMGSDTPLAVLSHTHPLLFEYFKQMFAQVTNPPIDALREKVVTSTTVYVGAQGNLLEEDAENCKVLKIENPILTDTDLLKIKAMDVPGFKIETLSICYYKNTDLEKAIDRLFVDVDRAYRDGANILILSDRDIDEYHVAIPSLLAVGAVSKYLVRTRKRTSMAPVSYTHLDVYKRQVLHRAILGSLDRFMAYLIEETKGKFPTWLAPVQVKVLPVSEKTLEYAEAITEKLVEAGVRVALDDDNQKIGYKIRAAQQVDRVPYMLVLGAKEAEAGNVSVRDRKGETTTMEVDEFIAKVTAEIKNRSL